MEEQTNDIPVRYFAVQFADKFIEGQFYGREYFYRTKKQDLKEGDIITKLNDEEVQDSAYLRYELYKYSVGDTIEITYIRDGEEHTTKVVLTSSNQS